MTRYTCFSCERKISKDLMGKRIRCPYCGNKIIYKSRTATTKVEAV